MTTYIDEFPDFILFTIALVGLALALCAPGGC
jgi:hypothetical protein